MREFIDGNGRVWSVKLDISAAKRIEQIAKFKIFDPENSDVLMRLMTDRILVADVLYAMIHPQAVSKGVTAEDFGSSLYGKPMGDARQAVVDELADFSEEPTRSIIQKQIKTLSALETEIQKQGATELEKIKIETMVRVAIDKISGRTSTDSQAQ